MFLLSMKAEVFQMVSADQDKQVRPQEEWQEVPANEIQQGNNEKRLATLLLLQLLQCS